MESSRQLRDLNAIYFQQVAEDSEYGYDKDGNSLNPVDIEKRKKEDDDLAGAPKKNGKKKVKRWWDDDGDGKGYEKGEVKKTTKEDTDLINKLRASGVFTEEELKKIAETDNE